MSKVLNGGFKIHHDIIQPIETDGGDMEFINGEDRNQTLLMPESVEDYVGDNNAIRVIDAYIHNLNLINMGFTGAELKGTGRPPYDPKDLLKLYVYGYMNRIRSSRRLETETKRNLEVIWLLGRLSPDHKTIARFRHDNAAALKNVFHDFVKVCLKLGLYGKELVAIDGSKFKAVNSKKRNFTEEKLKNRLERIDKHIAEYLAELENIDTEEDSAGGERSGEEIKRIISELGERKELYQGYVKELDETGEKQKSLTDPDSRLMTSYGKMDVCYNVQTAVDAKNKMIVDFKVTNHGNDKNFITPMSSSAKEVMGTETLTVVADGGYESAQDIVTAMGQGLDVHVAGTDFGICVPADAGEQAVIRPHRNGRCVYIVERNIALCPMGNVLYPRFFNRKKGWAIFHNNEACRQCSCKCTTNKIGCFRYQVPMAEADFSREYNEEGLAVKQIHIAPEKKIVKQRKSIVEHPFGTIKRSMDAAYCLTKGLCNVGGEFSLTFLAYNLKRAINILGCKGLIEGMA